MQEPRSSVSLCRTAVCDTVVSPANIFCPFCKERQKKSPLPAAEFARTGFVHEKRLWLNFRDRVAVSDTGWAGSEDRSERACCPHADRAADERVSVDKVPCFVAGHSHGKQGRYQRIQIPRHVSQGWRS